MNFLYEYMGLSLDDIQVLQSLNSFQYGYIDLDASENFHILQLVRKAVDLLQEIICKQIKYKSHKIVNKIENWKHRKNKGQEKCFEEIYEQSEHSHVDKEDVWNKSNFNIHPKTYCTLGHYHLLLNEFEKAFSAYQKYLKLRPNHWKDEQFLYGLGVVYFHFNFYNWSIKTFHKLLYQNTSFSCSNEVHVRLGLMHKVKEDYGPSLKHLKVAYFDNSPCTYSKLQIRFHIAHLYELKNKHKTAKKEYEQLLNEDELTLELKADIYRQLGWMYHRIESLGEKRHREAYAILCLQKSVEANPNSGQALYLLGRCFASINKVHDAFISYRNSVEKSEGNADTWCSIGVLYQQQNQPTDALQAYICAVQLDKKHYAAWTNLGILYESCGQPKDAYACYLNAVRSVDTSNNFLTLSVQNSNIKIIDNYHHINEELYQRIKFLGTYLSQAPLPSITSKRRQLCSIEEAWNLPISLEMSSRQQQFQNPYTLIDNQLQTRKLSRPLHETSNQRFLLTDKNADASVSEKFKEVIGLKSKTQQWIKECKQDQQLEYGLKKYDTKIEPTSGTPETTVHFNTFGFDNIDVKNQSLDYECDEFVAEDKKDTMKNTVSSLESNKMKVHNRVEGNSIIANISNESSKFFKNEPTKSFKNSITYNSYKDNVVGNTFGIYNFTNMDTPTFEEVDVVSKFSTDMNSKQLHEAVKKLSKELPRNCALLQSASLPPTPPDCPPQRLTRDQLLPPTPSVHLENKKHAFSPQLQEFCLKHPIAVVRGLAGALKLDLGLFSTKTLVEANPDHSIVVRTQVQQTPDESWDVSQEKRVWTCLTHRSKTTIAKYAQYQASSFQESLKDREKITLETVSDSDSKDSINNNIFNRKRRKVNKINKILRFGTNVDLSDERKWRLQLSELQKLPSFARVISASNMLSHVGHVILGMNTVELCMKVPGSRTAGHQENNNFCSINMNIGPGDCEWFAVPDAYWGGIHNLCEQNNISYLHGSWWPVLEDLYKQNIPVYRFIQRPGDLVWVNAGCVHWVQSVGWCNNIAWNVGPLTARQYSLALERYEWNKVQYFKSKVPMIHLSWNLARNIKVADAKLFELLKMCLLQTLRDVMHMLEYIKAMGLQIRYFDRAKNESSHYCAQCEVEVFNILFISEQEKQYVVYCMSCARKISSSLQEIICLEEYRLSELCQIYDCFELCKIQAPTSNA